MIYADFKDMPQTTVSDKVLHDKAFSNAKSPKYNGYQRGLNSLIYIFFDDKSSGRAVTSADKSAIRSEIMPNQQITEQ